MNRLLGEIRSLGIQYERRDRREKVGRACKLRDLSLDPSIGIETCYVSGLVLGEVDNCVNHESSNIGAQWTGANVVADGVHP